MLKKFMTLLLAAALSAGLAACGKTESSTGPQGGGVPVGGAQSDTGAGGSEKGGYVETEIGLPEDVNGEDIFQIGEKDGLLCLYILEEKESGTGFARYLYRDSSFIKDTPSWMENIVYEEDLLQCRVAEDADGSSYLYFVGMKGEALLGYLYRSRDGVTAEEITPQDWRIEDPEWHYYEYPDDITVLADGNIVSIYYNDAKVYSGEDGAILQELKLSSELYTGKIYGGQDKFYTISLNMQEEFSELEMYLQEKDEPEMSVKCDMSVGGNNHLAILSDGSVLLCGRGGLFQYSPEGEWSCIIKGSYSSFALETMYCLGLAAPDATAYYALFSTEDAYCLMKYTYDEELVRLPETELTVYTLYDNTTVRHAAAMYTRLHPEIHVEVEVGIPYEELQTADVKAEIQGLYTRLLAGEKTDLLILDGLDADAFIEQGMLADIGDIVTPMSEQGVILKNIADNYTLEDGAVYCMPLRISLSILCSTVLDTSTAEDMEKLTKVLDGYDRPLLGPMTVDELTSVFVPFMVQDLVNGKELDKKALEKHLQTLKQLAACSNMVERFTDEITPYHLSDYSFREGVICCELGGFLDSMMPLSMLADTNSNYASFEGAFRPVGEIAVLKESDALDVAKDFLKYTLSAEVQDSDFRDGFPINAEALKNQKDKDRSAYEAYAMFVLPGGGVIEFEIIAVSEKDANQLIEMCKNVHKRLVEDEEIEKVIAEALPAYLNGSATPEQTVSTIESGLRMYLAE